MTNESRAPVTHDHLDPAYQRLLIEAVLAKARRLRAEAMRDLLRRAGRFIYRTLSGAARLVRGMVRRLMQRSGSRTTSNPSVRAAAKAAYERSL